LRSENQDCPLFQELVRL